MKFALFSGSAPSYDPSELVRLLAEQGWDGVEWRITDQPAADVPGFWAGNRATFPFTGLADRIEEITRTTAGAGLAVAGLAGYASIDDVAAVETLLRAAADAGAPVARVTVPKAMPGSDYRELFVGARRAAERVEKIAERAGAKAVVQIHHGSIVSTASAALRLFDGLDPRHIGAIHDLGNLAIEGREGLDSHSPGLQILGAYLAHVHVKNAVWVPRGPRADGTIDWEWQWASLREGLGDVPGYLASLEEIEYDGWVVVENFTTDLPLEVRLGDDLAYLNRSLVRGRSRRDGEGR